MIKIPSTEKFWNSHPMNPLMLILAIIVSCCQCAPIVPLNSHQFKLTCAPVLSGTRTFNITLPTSYNNTFSRYLVLSGFQANIRDKVNFQTSLTTNTATTQSISVTVSSMAMILLSVQVVFIATNDWIWAMSSSYSCNTIRNFYLLFSPISEDTYTTPTGGTITTPTQYKIIPFVSYYNTASWAWPFQLFSANGPPNIIKFTASILSASTVKLTFSREDSIQFVYQVGYVLLFYNNTQLQIQNFIYRDYTVVSSTPFNQPPNGSYVSTTFGGFQGNCLIGISNIKVSGQYDRTANRGPTFSKTSPISNLVNNKQSKDSFSVTYNVLCFTGQVCATPLIYDPSVQACIICPIAHCPTCLTLTVCKKCQNFYGWQAPNCSLCTSITTGCLTCDNSSYCYSCVDNHYVLNASQCVKCADFIMGCDTCTNQTFCTKCLSLGYYNDTVSCTLCNLTLPHCLICDNGTVCLGCESGYYQDTAGLCLPCNTTINFCSLCDNDTVCLGCQTSYVLMNNTCIQCNYFLPNCTACTDSTHCTACNATYYLLSPTACELCSIPIPNCILCNDANTCTSCAPVFFLDPNNKCSPCNTNIAQCTMCTDGFTCMQCATNYLLSGTVCLPCQSVLSYCQTCTNSTYCTSCISDSFYIPNSIGFCLPCSAGVMNCDRCNLSNSSNSTSILSIYQVKCIACSNPYMIDMNGQCQECEILIPNCNYCLNYTFCEQCIAITYAFWAPNMSCVLCSDLIRNCSQCTSQICTKCMSGFRLSPNSKSCNCLLGYYKNGVCNTIKGCSKPFLYADGSIGCLQCQQPVFFAVPVYDHCQCRKGTLIGDICSQIKNCIAALIAPNGSIYCAFCNITAGFYYLPQNQVQCVCVQHFVSNGTYCNDVCGDGFLMNSTSKDNCDDGNTLNGDGCNQDCTVQPLFRCQNGSKTSPSKCYYVGGKATMNLSRITKTWNMNQATFEFEINPKLSTLSQMDFSNLLNLTCDSDYLISGYTYNQGILAVNVDYTKDMKDVACNLTLDFDRNIIRSPSVKLSFYAKSSNYPLIFSNFLQSLTKIKLSFQILSFIVLGSFGFSLAHKLMGAQLLICCQIVYLSNCFYRIPSIYLTPVKQFKFVTGDWSLFYKEQYLYMVSPFSERVEISAYFLENTLFVISILLFLIVIVASILLFSMLKREKSNARQSKVPLIKKTFESKEYRMNESLYKPKKIKEKRVQPQKFVDSLAFKVVRTIFRTLFFPIVTGYFIIIVVSSYIHSNSLDSKNLREFHPVLNAGAELFAWITLGIVVSFQVFGSLVKGNGVVSRLVGEQNTKGWYIHVFVFRLIAVTIVIQLGIFYSYDFLIYILGIVELAYLVILIFFKGYTTILDSVGVVSCLITECYAIALPILARSVTIPQGSFVIMIYVLIGMLFFSIIVTNIRNYFVIKSAIIELAKYCKKDPKPKQKLQRNQDQLKLQLYQNKKKKYHLFMRPTDKIDQIDQDLHRIQAFKQTCMHDLILNKDTRASPLGKIESVFMEQQQQGQQSINIEEDPEFKKTKERLKEDFRKKIKSETSNH